MVRQNGWMPDWRASTAPGACPRSVVAAIAVVKVVRLAVRKREQDARLASTSLRMPKDAGWPPHAGVVARLDPGDASAHRLP